MESGERGIHIKHEDEEKDIDESEEKDTIDDDADENKLSPEQEEEAKLRAKYPMAMRPGGSAFLQKRLQKGQKYFDSGDYNMAKAATKSNKTRVNIDKLQLPQTTGEAIPTPETVPPRKASIQQSKLAAGLT